MISQLSILHCLIILSTQNSLNYLNKILTEIFIRFGSKLYRQIVGIPMGTNCAPLVEDLFLFCYLLLHVVSF